MTPLVSVIIPTYNRLKYLCEAVESVLAQTYRNYEIIVVNDGSNVDVKKALRPYMDKIKYLYQNNKGKSAARNRGIRNSCGKYLAFLDDDDIFEPRKLEVQVPFLETDVNLGFVYSDYYIFEGNNKKKSRLSLATGRDMPSDRFAQLFFMNPNVAISAFLARRRCFQKIDLFDESLLHHEDGDMFLRIALSWPTQFSDYPSTGVRFHDKKSSRKRIEMYEAVIKSSKKILASYPKFRKSLGITASCRISELYFQLGRAYLNKKMVKNSITQFKSSRRLSKKYVNAWTICVIFLKMVLKPSRQFIKKVPVIGKIKRN